MNPCFGQEKYALKFVGELMSASCLVGDLLIYRGCVVGDLSDQLPEETIYYFCGIMDTSDHVQLGPHQLGPILMQAWSLLKLILFTKCSMKSVL